MKTREKKTGKGREIARRVGLGGLTLAGLLLVIQGIAIPLSYFPWHWIGAALFCAGLTLWAYRILALIGKKHPKTARVLRIIFTVCLCLLLVSFAVIEALILRGEVTDPDAEGADTVIVLGAGINGEEPSLMLWYRLRTALEYMERNPDCTVIVSGGQGSDERYSEAHVMRRWLVRNGADPDRIVMEDKSHDTVENFLNSRALPEFHGSVVVISSDFHLTRALWIAEDLGLEARGVAAPTQNGLLSVNFHIREFFSVVVYLLADRARLRAK